jgi:poly(hydroxyalkanoate) depolymerase family esterase
MKSEMGMAELMHEFSGMMLSLGPRDTIKTMQRVLLEMAPPKGTWPYDDARSQTRTDRDFAQDRKRDMPVGGKFIEGSVTNHAGTRGYKLYVPSCYRGQPLPLVVMLHGCKQDPDDFATGTRMNQMAEERQCLVAYPAQARFASRPKCWNWFYPKNQQRGRGEPALIADITCEIIRSYNIDENMVFVAGLSAGGAMAAIMAMTYPDIFAAAAVHSGMPASAARDLYSALSAMKHGPRKHRGDRIASDVAESGPSVPMIIFHGDADSVVHPANGDHVLHQVVSNHSEAAADDETGPESVTSVVQHQLRRGRSYTRILHHDKIGQNIAEQWLIHGGGHAWSGGCASGSHTDPKGPDATKEMMRFFYEQAQQNWLSADRRLN